MKKNVFLILLILSYGFAGCSGGSDSGAAQAEDPSGDQIVNRAALQKTPTQNDTFVLSDYNTLKSSLELSSTRFLNFIGSPYKALSEIKACVYPSGRNNTCESSDLPTTEYADANGDAYPDSTFSGNFTNCVDSTSKISGSFRSTIGQSYYAKYDSGSTISSDSYYTVADMTKSGSGNNATMSFRFKHGLENSRSEYVATWLNVTVSGGTPTLTGYIQIYKASSNSFKTYKLSLSGATYNATTECLGGTLSITDGTSSVTLSSGTTSGSNFINSYENVDQSNIDILGGSAPLFCLKYMAQ